MRRFGLFLIFFSLFFLATPASAASGHVLMVSPSVSEVTIDPGGTATKRLSAVNQGDLPFDLTLSVAPYSVINKAYDVSFEPLPGRVPVQEWISLSGPNKTALQPSKVYDVDYTISVPTGTPAGGYSAVLLVESAIATTSTSGISAKNRIAHIIYINVNGAVKKRGYVEAPNPPLITFSTQQTVLYTARNEGGTNEKAKIDTKIADLFGRSVLSETTERYVLPGTQRSMNVEWASKGIFGIYRIERSTSIAGNTQEATSRWTIVIHPLFLLIALIVVIGTVWLNRKQLHTIRVRHAKK